MAMPLGPWDASNAKFAFVTAVSCLGSVDVKWRRATPVGVPGHEGEIHFGVVLSSFPAQARAHCRRTSAPDRRGGGIQSSHPFPSLHTSRKGDRHGIDVSELPVRAFRLEPVTD